MEVRTIYIYPDNLTAKAMLWLWELRDIGIIGVGLLLSVLALTQTGIAVPLVLTAVFAFLTIRHEGTSILDFIRYADRESLVHAILKKYPPQTAEWQGGRSGKGTGQMHDVPMQDIVVAEGLGCEHRQLRRHAYNIPDQEDAT